MFKKKQSTIFIMMLFTIIIAVFWYLYPFDYSEETAGTIGKVEKFRESSTGDNSIVLRSELLKDSVLLEQTLAGLLLFNGLTNEFAAKLDSSHQLIGTNLNMASKLDSLDNLLVFNEFLRNNTENLNMNLKLITSVLSADTTDLSIDADNTLLQLDNYLIQLQNKNELLAAVVRELDSKMKDLDVEIPDTNIAQLVTARDQLLGNIFKYGMFIFNRDKLSSFSAMKILQASNLEKIVFDKEKLAVMSNENSLKNREDLLKLLARDKSLDLIYIYDIEKLGVGNAFNRNLGSQYAYGPKMFACFLENLKAIYNQDKLNMIFSGGTKENLGPIVYTNIDMGVMNQMKEKGIFDKAMNAIRY